MELVISSYCRIKGKNISVNGRELSLPATDTVSLFLTEAYKALDINYPKFHKMDNLCKLGMLATEAALKDSDFFKRNSPADVAIVFANNASSLDTDRAHQNSINDKNQYLPSPATFVYTLPNIIIGEIAIKHKITGENIFFVDDNFDAGLMAGRAEVYLQSGLAAAAISGWINYDKGEVDALIYLVETISDSIKNTNFIPLNKVTLTQIYK